MSAPATPATGLFDAMRGVGRTLNEMVQVRGALFTLELNEEIGRRSRILVLGALVFAFLHAALLTATLLSAAVFWDSHRIEALGAMAAIYLACGLATLLALRSEIASNPAPFSASLAGIERDLAELRRPP